MKLLLVALFTIGIGCCSAYPEPIGCGSAVLDEYNAIRPFVNINGQNTIDDLSEAVLQIRDLIQIGNIQGLSTHFVNVGASGYRNLAATTSDACLQQAFLSIAEAESFVAYLLQSIRDPNEAAELACNTLSYNAQRINSCSSETAYVVLV